MPSLAFVGKHSQDAVLSVYLRKRVFVDHGQGIEPVQGVVRLDPQVAAALAADDAVFAALHVYFVFESGETGTDILDFTLYEHVVQVYPRTPDDAGPQLDALLGKVVLPDQYHFPFVFRVPLNLPPSITLNPGLAFYGRPIGVSYEVAAYVASRVSATAVVPAVAPATSIVTAAAPAPPVALVTPAAMRHHVAMLFLKKTDYFPLVRDIAPSDSATKAYFGSTRPLKLIARLDHEIYRVGQPIAVHVELTNDSNHDVNAIRISAKQVVEASVRALNVERFKTQVASLESSDGCPIRRHQVITRTYIVTPEIPASALHRCARAGTLNMNDPTVLAPSTRSNEAPVRRSKGLTVSYYLNVHAVVSLGHDTIVSLPFALSDFYESANAAGTVAGLAVSSPLAPPATSSALPPPPAPVAGVITAVMQPPSAPPPAPVLVVSSAGASSAPVATGGDKGVRGGDQPLLREDLVRALAAVRGARATVVSMLNAPFEENVAALDASRSEAVNYQMLTDTVNAAVARLQTLVADLSLYDAMLRSQTGTLLANEHTQLIGIVQRLASHEASYQKRQPLFSTLAEATNSLDGLMRAGLDLLHNPSLPDLRFRLRSVADAALNSYNNIQMLHPGKMEVTTTISAISAALSELLQPTSVSVAPAVLQHSLDTINAEAANLSGALRQTPVAAKGTAEQLASVAMVYRTVVPRILSAGKTVAGGINKDDVRQAYVTLLQLLGDAVIRLLKCALLHNQNPTNSLHKSNVDMGAQEAADTLKRLLNGTSSLQMQLQQLTGAPAASPSTHISSTLVSPGVLEQSTVRTTAPPIVKPATASATAAVVGSVLPDDVLLQQTRKADTRLQQFATPGSGSGNAERTLAGTPDETLRLLRTRVDAVSRRLVNHRSSPSRRTFTVERGYVEIAGSPSPLIDRLYVIAKSTSQAVAQATLRHQEVFLLTQSLLDVDREVKQREYDSWSAVFVDAVRSLATSVEDLTVLGERVSEAMDTVANLSGALARTASAATKVMTASRTREGSNSSQVQRSLEILVNRVLQTTSHLGDISNKNAAAPVNVPHSRVGQVEDQLRVLKLEQDLTLEREMTYTRAPPARRAPTPRVSSRSVVSDSEA